MRARLRPISAGRGEFWIAGMFGTFSTFRQRVQVTVGNTVPADTSSVTLSAYDVGDSLVAPPATSLVSGAGPPVTLTVMAPGLSPNIAYFLVQSGDYNKGLWVDDLTYDNPTTQAPPDFAFDVQGNVWPGSALFVGQGGSLTRPLPLRRFNGSNGEITLTASDLPAGVTATFSPNPVVGTDTTTNLSLSAAPNAPPIANAPFSLTGSPAGPLVAPGPRDAQLLTTVEPAIIITTDGAGGAHDLPPCTPLHIGPVYVLKDASAVHGDVALSLRVFVSPTETADLPPGVHATIEPPVSDSRFPFTVHEVTLSYDAGALSSGTRSFVVQGTAGTLVALSQPFTVPPIALAIDDVEPPSGQIPNLVLGRPGTMVTITGQGFCPGTKVRFGNMVADVEPDSLTPTRITATVPVLATNDIVLVDPHGNTSGSKPFAVDSVRNTAGFSFHNYVPHTTFDQLTAAYGADQTEDRIPLCWPFDCTITFHDPGAILWLNFLKSFTDTKSGGGACFGIALASQRLDAGQRPRGDFPPPGATDNFALDAAGGPSGPLTEYVNSQVTVQISEEYLGDYLNQSYFNSFGHTADVLREIHSRITMRSRPARCRWLPCGTGPFRDTS
jgi:IPT/TIG domain